MKCNKCGNELSKGAKFCNKCGAVVSGDTSSKEKKEMGDQVTIVEGSKDIIKCGNCEYIGEGKPGRTTGGKILAWVGIVFSPLIPLLYYSFTHKYICPKCNSTFIGIKNKEGVFTEPAKSNPALILLVVLIIIAVIGILSSVVVVSLNSARAKARDAKRVADIQEVKTSLNSYYASNRIYPNSLDELVPAYLKSLPIAPSEGEAYLYTSSVDSLEYHLGAYLEQVAPGTGVLSNDSDCNSIEGVCFTKQFSLGFNGEDPVYDLTNYSY